MAKQWCTAPRSRRRHLPVYFLVHTTPPKFTKRTALHSIHVMAAVPSCCYFCLDDGKDEDEKPVVRNCSCRGDSAGYAHLSCLIKNATHKSLQISRTTSTKFDATAFTEPWETCINCKQSFKGQLALDMGTTLVVFTESTYYNVDDNSSNPPSQQQQMSSYRN